MSTSQGEHVEANLFGTEKRGDAFIPIQEERREIVAVGWYCNQSLWKTVREGWLNDLRFEGDFHREGE